MRSSISVLASLSFLLSASLAAQVVQPYSHGGKLIIETALPDTNGISENEFSSFEFRGPVEFNLNPSTKAVKIKIKDGAGLKIVDSYDIQIKRAAGKDRVMLTIEHPASITLQNSSFLDTDVQLVSSQVNFIGLGVNATNSLSVKSSARSNLNGPIIAERLDIDGRFQINARIVARNANFTNSERSVARSKIDVAESFVFDGVRFDISGQISGAQIDLRSKEELFVEKGGSLLAKRPDLSTATSDESLSIRVPSMTNKGTIFSNKSLNIYGNTLNNNAGVIKSGGDLTLTGVKDGKIFGMVSNKSGQITSSGKMSISAVMFRQSPIEVEWVAKAKITETVETYPVSVACKGSNKFYAATETVKTQSIQPYMPALLSSKGGIDFHVRSIVNILSRIESIGDVWMDEKGAPQIALDALYTSTIRSLVFENVLSPCRERARRHLQCAYRDGADVANELVKNKCEVLEVKNSNGSVHECTYVNHRKNSLNCKNVMSPHPASMVYGGTVYGKAASMRLSQWAHLHGKDTGWIPTLRGDTTWRKEQITARDQIIPIELGSDILDLLGRLRIASTQHQEEPKKEEPKKEEPKTAWTDSSGYAGIKSVLDPLNIKDFKTLDPTAEFFAINAALARQTGNSDTNPHDLLKNSVEMIKRFNLKPGQCPTDAEIETATVPYLCSGWRHFTDGRPPILAPIAIIPKSMVADWRSKAAAQFQGELIDLTVAGTADIDGTIKAIKDKLILKAKDIVLKGLAEGKDVSLKAENSLVLESIRDIVTGRIASRAKIKAEGTAEIHGQKEVTSISSEIQGKNVIVRSEGVLTVIPLELFTHFQDTFSGSAQQTARYEQCKKFLGNEWTATGGEMKVSSAQDASIKGGSYKGDNIFVGSDKGKVDVEGLREECVKLVQKESSGFFSSSTEQELKKTRDIVNANFEATNTLEIKSAKDTNLRSVDIDADTLKLNVGGHFKLEGDKASEDVKKESSSSHFFSSGESGTFYLFGGESKETLSYDETVKKSTINTKKIEVSAKSAKMSGVDLNTDTGRFTTPGGLNWTGMTEEHRSSSSRAKGGLYFGGTADEGEWTFSVNLGGSLEKDQGSTIKQDIDTVKAPGGIIFDSGSSDIIFTGVNQDGKFSFKSRSVENHGVRHRICLEGELWSASIGFKGGAKSRLTRALAGIYQTAQTKIEIVEDGVNLGFKVLENTVELVTGVLLPYEFGIWVFGGTEANKKHQCFDAITSAKGNFVAPKGEFALNINATEGIWFDGVNYAATSARLKGKTLNVTAMKGTTESHEWGAKASGEVNIQGVGVPSASASGSIKQGSSTTWHPSKINVEGRLELDISETATLDGAQVSAGELFANIGKLVLRTLENRMQATAAGGNISIDPTQFGELSKLLTGGGASGLYENKKWVSDVTYLVGTKVAEIIVKDTITLVAAVIANAEKDADGKLVDKGNLKLSAARIIHQDLSSEHRRFGAGLSYSKGIHKAIPGAISGDFTFANIDQSTHATIGKGNVTITENPDELNYINRDLKKIQQTDGIDIQPIHFYIPIVSPENMGILLDELSRAATHPIDHVVRIFKRNMQGMTWFVDPKDWAPEQDAQLRKLFDRLQIVGEEVAQDPEIKEAEDELKKEKAEAEKRGDKDRQEELKVAEKDLEHAKDFKALEKVYAEHNGESKDKADAAAKIRANSLARAKRLTKPGTKGGFDRTTSLHPDVATEFKVDQETNSKIATERQLFLERMQKNGFFENQGMKKGLHHAIDESRKREAAGDLGGSYRALREYEYGEAVYLGLMKYGMLGEILKQGKASPVVIKAKGKIESFFFDSVASIAISAAKNPRVLGSIQAVGGGIQFVAGAVGGAATSWTGFGAVLGVANMALGVDNLAAGIDTVIFGEHQSTLLNKGLRASGISPEAAAYLEIVANLASGIASMRAAGKMAASQIPGKVLEKSLPGAAAGARPIVDQSVRVGRWMSDAEYQKMLKTGMVQESFSGTTHVAKPASPSAFLQQAKRGSLYIEFDVPSSSLVSTGEGWGKILGPNSVEGRMAALNGIGAPSMPQASNIVHVATKTSY